MNRSRKLSLLFGILAVLLSDVMCAVIASHFTAQCWGIRYAGYSAPPTVAFLYAIPFIPATGICAFLAWKTHRSK